MSENSISPQKEPLLKNIKTLQVYFAVKYKLAHCSVHLCELLRCLLSQKQGSQLCVLQSLWLRPLFPRRDPEKWWHMSEHFQNSSNYNRLQSQNVSRSLYTQCLANVFIALNFFYVFYRILLGFYINQK